ncbi:MAG: CRISPR-associated protein Csx14 [Archaeoglobaceae archaeon]
MKTAVIAPRGLSPPVITTFVDGIGEPVNDLVVLTTENEDVKAGYELIRIGIKRRYPKMRLHEVSLPFEDVNTTEENLQFMSICAKIIREEREKYKCDKILLNVAGGRKNMCITLSLLGQLMGVDGVYHVISKDVKIVNQLLENLRSSIREIYRAKTDDEKIRIYGERERHFDGLLFPNKKEYEIIRIPTLPYPPDYLAKLIKALEENDLDTLSWTEKRMLESHGVLKSFGGRFRVSDYGKRLVDALLVRL